MSTLPGAESQLPSSQESGRMDSWLFTDDRVQNLRLRQTGLALLLMALCVLVMQFAVWLGDAPAGAVRVWTLVSLGGLLAVYLLIRSGWSQRLADPSMTVP